MQEDRTSQDTFQTKASSLHKLLSSDKLFVIPRYQRAYSWTPKEIKDFIKDVQKLEASDHPVEHFFGVIICIHKNTVLDDNAELEVIDGQQRLTTFIVLILAVCHALEEISSKASKDGDIPSGSKASQLKNNTLNKYVFCIDEHNKKQPKLYLSKTNRDFFQRMINEQIKIDHKISDTDAVSNDKLLKALKTIYQQLLKTPILDKKDISLVEKIEKVEKLLFNILNRAIILSVINANKQNAYKLFSVINDRGKKLSEGDLLRSETLALLDNHETEQEMVEADWDEILRTDESIVRSFLQHYAMSHSGSEIPEKDVLDFYRTDIFDIKYDPIDQADLDKAKKLATTVGLLKSESKIYEKLYKGIWPFDNSNKVADWDRKQLEILIVYEKHTISLPLLLSAVKLDEKTFADLVNRIVLFSFRYISILKNKPTPLGNKYRELAKKIREDAKTFSLKLLRSELEKLKNQYASDNLFKASLEEKNFTDDNQMGKILLLILNDYISWSKREDGSNPVPAKGAVLSPKTLTLEHIYPQNPSQAIEDLKEHTQKIGNLTLLTDAEQNKAANKSFVAKKRTYEESQLEINRQLAELADWNLEEYNKRTTFLLDLANKIFTA
jgi:hypothetical protein